LLTMRVSPGQSAQIGAVAQPFAGNEKPHGGVLGRSLSYQARENRTAMASCFFTVTSFQNLRLCSGVRHPHTHKFSQRSKRDSHLLVTGVVRGWGEVRCGRWDMSARDIVFFIALMATAVASGGALAHAFELPNKIDLPGNEYFIVQKAYRGWNQLAYVLFVELLSMISLAVIYRHEPFVRWFVILALVCLVCAQVLFWVYTYPANVGTQNWTVMPDNWAMLRHQWEYSHLGGAVFQLGAIAALIVAALGRRPGGDHHE
jgi:hypothetical protein